MWMWEADHEPKAVIVMVHSVFEHHRRYAWVIESLRESGFHVVMGDLPGHGEQAQAKTMHNESVGEYELYIERAIEYAAKLQVPIFLFGHGFGATLILDYMRKKRDHIAGLLVTNPWLELKYTPSKWSNRLAKLSISQKFEFPVPAHLLTSNEELQKEYDEDTFIHSIVTTDWYESIQERMKIVLNTTKEWDVPIWLQLGEEDELIDSKAVRKWVNQQTMTTLSYSEWPHMKHDLHQEMDREFLAKSAINFIELSVLRLGYVL